MLRYAMERSAPCMYQVQEGVVGFTKYKVRVFDHPLSHLPFLLVMGRSQQALLTSLRKSPSNYSWRARTSLISVSKATSSLPMKRVPVPYTTSRLKESKSPKVSYPFSLLTPYDPYILFSLPCGTGLALPTCISVNNCVAHFSPLACVLFSPYIHSFLTTYTKYYKTTTLPPCTLPTPRAPILPPAPSLNIPSRAHSSDPLSEQKLAKGDVVKLRLGAHTDGFSAISAETTVVAATSDSPVTGRRAEVLRAAWTAAEVAMHLVRVGG